METLTAVEVPVNLPSLLRDSMGRQEPLTTHGATLAEALRNLFAQYPLLRIHLYEESGKLRPHVLLFYNDENVAWLDSLDVPLRPGDQLHVIQAVSGG